VRRWELVAGGSAKFWEIGQTGRTVTVRFGRLHTTGQTQTKELVSPEAATAHVAKLVTEKEKKGYRPVTSPKPSTPPANSEPKPVNHPADTLAPPHPATDPTAADSAAVDQPSATLAPHKTSTTAPPQPATGQPTTAAVPRKTAAASVAPHPVTGLTSGQSTTANPPQPTPAAPATPQPALTTTEAPSAPSRTPPTKATPAPLTDEDTWVMPKPWLRDVVRQRGFHPPPTFSLDDQQAARARQRATKQQATLDRVMAAPESDPDLVQAARNHLNGHPNPVGAAAIAVMTTRDVASVHHWIADHGLVFAVEAVVESVGMYTNAKWLPHQSQWSNPHLYRYATATHPSLDTEESRMLTAVRYALAVADEAEREAAEAVLERIGAHTTPLLRAYLLPGRRADWFEQACQEPHSVARWWMLLCSASTYDEFVKAQTSVNNGAQMLYTALYVLGPAIAPLLAEDLDKSYQRAETRKQALKVLAALPTDEAFTILLDRVDTKYVRPALLSAMAAFPVRAARLLGERASDEELRRLLAVHLTTHPQLEAPDGFTAVDTAAVPEAPAEALPEVLASPPWLRRRSPVQPVVVPDVPVPAPSVVWEPGEQDAWLNGAHWGTYHDWRHLLKEYVAGRSGNDLFLMAPEDEVRHLLADWEPKYGWSAEQSGKRIAARFGLDALPPLLRIVESNTNAATILLPFACTEVAAVMADWLVRLKQARRVAIDWLARHREAAAGFLVPAALGTPGAARRNAEAAIRRLHGMGVDVVGSAPTAEAAAGIEALLSAEPVDVLPAKLPVIGEWADTRLLPQVLLSDRKHALSPEAAKHLLMTAALSKPGDVYAGLPIAREALDRDSLAEFAWAVFQRWQEVGAPPKEGWALTALGWFGDDSTVRALSPLIRAWPGESQHAKAVAALDVLADIGTEVALSHLSSIAEKVKFKGLKTRAQEKVTQIAAELGLSREQLADRLVPRLGLDDEASLVIDYGPRRFRVGFDEQLKPHVLDPDGKRRKDLPKPGAKDDQEKAPLEHKRYLALKKDVRAVAADQIHRLERAMVEQRTWTAEEFHTVLAGHPLLRHIVRRLVWITDGGVSFRLAEDRTLADSSDDELTLSGDATVRVAHPVDLQDSLAAWGEVFADYEILQPFPQLGRPLHVLAPGEDFRDRLDHHRDRPYAVGRILSLTKRGWVRGEPQDAGVECWITRPLPGGGALVASLDPGIAVGAVDVFPEIKFTALWYSTNGDGYWSTQKNAPATVEADPITVSEILSELESLHG
jgi:predicted DNA-binding WGR domain protein